jgi:hypothetical protein
MTEKIEEMLKMAIENPNEEHSDFEKVYRISNLDQVEVSTIMDFWLSWKMISNFKLQSCGCNKEER